MVVMLIRRAPSTLDWDSVKIGRLDSEVRRLCFKSVSLAGGVAGARLTSHLVSLAWPWCWFVMWELLGAPRLLGVVLGVDLLVGEALFCVWGVLGETAPAGVG